VCELLDHQMSRGVWNFHDTHDHKVHQAFPQTPHADVITKLR
jgi:hypothetical protein